MNKEPSNEETTSPIKWKGKQAFYITGTEHDDDTIRIVPDGREELLTLILPTLCITYADMRFANSIGGVQREYPDSVPYGLKYFQPPVELTDEKEIEKFTWIRGAERVTIGPEETIIQWRGWRDLVIPKLRIKAEEKVEAVLNVPDVIITVSQPFVTKVMQYTDGRHVGGIQVVKRHPDWKPEPFPEEYDLWVRVIDGPSRSSLPEAKVNLFTWEAEEPKGAFVLEAQWYTNGMGIVDNSGLPCSDKKLVIIEHKPWLPQIWRFRPLPGQKVKRTFKLWKANQISCSYEWQEEDTLEAIAELTGSQQATILEMNSLHSVDEIKPGSMIEIPFFEAVHHIEARDTLELLAEYFCYNSVEELAAVNELPKPYELYQDQELHLQGWRFFQARAGDLFENLDEQFGLPGGWSRPAQRMLHDDPTRAFEHEVVAVPTQEFARSHNVKRLY